jgi:6-phospho-beta-glucosidase
VPCRVMRTGPIALPAGSLPAQVRDLVVHVKAYERKTIAAVEANRKDALVDALAHNPLVPSRELAATLIDELALSAR